MFKNPYRFGNRPPAPAAPTKKYWPFILCGSVILVVLSGSIFFIVRASTPKAPQEIPHSDTTLTPDKKTGIFDSLRDFFFSDAPVLDGQADDRVNILALGVGGAGHDGSYLSDTNIIISIKPSTRQVSLISIPRDLMIKYDRYGYQKINAVSSYAEVNHPGEGGEFARQFFAQQFGLSIPYYVRVDFQAFIDAVNTVGGVTIDVPNSFTDYRYPGANYSYQTVNFTKGTETMDGDRALIYSRSRHGNNGEGSDFARSRRQQQVILALKQKLLSTGNLVNPVVIKQLFDTIATHVKTNLSFNQLLYLASLSQSIPSDHIKNVVIDDSRNGLIIPQQNQLGDVLIPKSGTFIEINDFIAHVFDQNTRTTALTSTLYSPSIPPPASSSTQVFPSRLPTTTVTASQVAMDVYNGTWEIGLAARVKRTLEGKDLVIRSIGNSPKRPISTSALYVLNPGVPSSFLQTIAQSLKLELVTAIPDWLIPTTTPSGVPSSSIPLPPPDLVIMIGTDLKLR